MKCLKCGYVTSESKEKCARCGSPLPAQPGLRGPGSGRTATPPVTPVAPVERGASTTPTEPLPDWRKEVSRKVKEYGEKKRILTTPPHALKNAAERRVEPDPEPPVPQEPPRPRFATAAFSRVEPAEPDPPSLDPVPPPPPVREPEARAPRQLPPLNEEVFAGDLNEELFLDETEDEESAEARASLHLGRRAAALIIDSTILVALHTCLLYLCAEIISYNFHNLFLEAWLPLAGIFLLFHCLYYAYFYKTSRQTPGQVFFRIELRDPLSGNVSLSKILIRWLCLVCLNVFNLVPLLLGRPFLLLDRLSGTFIRPLR